MKYQDNLNKGYVNGVYVGIKSGSPTQDAADPARDDYDHIRSIEYVGTVLQDADGTNHTPEE